MSNFTSKITQTSIEINASFTFLKCWMMKILKTVNTAFDVKIKIFQKKISDKVNFLPILLELQMY